MDTEVSVTPHDDRFVRNVVAEKLARDEIVRSVIVKLVTNVAIAGMIKSAGFDAFFVDMEHSTFDLATTTQICTTALGVGLTPFVRIPEVTPMFVSGVLDGGAFGVIGPHIETAEDAERLVSLAKFPPRGKRGVAGPLPHHGYLRLPSSEVHPQMDRLTMVATMIESAGALKGIEQIASVDGIDILLVGCQDLSVALGVPGRVDDPVVEAAVRKIIDAARKHGKHAWLGGLMGKQDMIDRLIVAGARIVSTGADSEILGKGLGERADSLNAAEKLLRGRTVEGAF